MSHFCPRYQTSKPIFISTMASRLGKSLLKVLNPAIRVYSRRGFTSTAELQKKYNIPPSGNELQRPAGISSFCRLPVQETTEGTKVYLYITNFNSCKIILKTWIAIILRPDVHSSFPGLDVAFVGVTLDSVASNRSGTRYGPRQMRTESVMLRAFNKETGKSVESSW